MMSLIICCTLYSKHSSTSINLYIETVSCIGIAALKTGSLLLIAIFYTLAGTALEGTANINRASEVSVHNYAGMA